MFDTDPEKLSATANFFDLGGTSLDILRLRSLVAQRLGAHDLQIITVLTAPTVRELAARLGEDAGAERPYDPIVPMQVVGDKTPLFCVHPGVGEVLVFVNLAKYFVGDRPFYALRARGFNPGEKPFESFEEMVSTYVDAIRAKQPHGPYAVAGYSYGGAVAFEIAKVLEAQGERVDFVGSFNLPPHIKYRMNELDFVETAANLAFFLALIDKKQSLDLPGQLRHLTREEQLAHFIDLAPPARLAELDLTLEKFTAWATLADGLTDLGRTYAQRLGAHHVRLLRDPAARHQGGLAEQRAEPLGRTLPRRPLPRRPRRALHADGPAPRRRLPVGPAQGTRPRARRRRLNPRPWLTIPPHHGRRA